MVLRDKGWFAQVIDTGLMEPFWVQFGFEMLAE